MHEEATMVEGAPYQRVGGLASLQGDLQVRQGGVHLVHLLLTVVHVVVRGHDGQLVDVVLHGRERERERRRTFELLR